MRRVLGAWLVIVFLVLGIAIAQDVENQRERNAWVGYYYAKASADSDTVQIQVDEAVFWWPDLFWWLRKEPW